jgi:hypothetical protein
LIVRGEAKGRQLGLIAQFGQKHTGEYGDEHFNGHEYLPD